MTHANDATPERGALVWDLPTRLFHWLTAGLVVTSWISAEIGGNAMTVHVWSGLSLLSLVLFRVMWGFLGGTYARFSNFVRGPRAAADYAAALLRGQARPSVGHNPLGALMVVALLANLGVQAATGLFANDDVMLEGPLAARVSKETSDLLTKVHHLSFNVLLVLIALHIAAAIYYLVVKRENLIRPMITGRKRLPAIHGDGLATPGRVWLAALVLALCAAAVWLPLA